MSVPGQRLSLFAEAWRQAGADPSLLSLVRDGHKIIFEDGPPPLTLPSTEYETKLPEPKMVVIPQEISNLLGKGAIRVVPREEAIATPGHYSQIFAVPKPGGKWRVVINLKPLNEHVAKETFHMETSKDVRSLLRPSDYGAVIDLTDAYYTVKLHNDSRKYCRFIVDGIIYEYVALPMGLTCSARIFTRVALFVGSRLRRAGVRIVLYIDDLLVIAISKELCDQHVQELLKAIDEFGFLLNEKKSHLSPAQSFQYLGMVWDTSSWKVSVRPEREEKIRSAAQQLLEASTASCRAVSVFLGRTGSCVGAIPLARARVRRLQWDFLAVCTSTEMFDAFMTISDEAKEELGFWADLPPGLSSPITVGPSAGTVTTDASETGIGILFDCDLISEPIPDEFSSFHINVKELFALKRFLDLFPNIRNTVLTWRCNSNCAMAAIRKEGSTRSWPMSLLSCNILTLSHERGVVWDPVRVTSEENLLADAASRFQHVQDWSLSPSATRKIFARWGTPDVDLMASNESRKVPVFFSWSRQDTEAWGLDSLAQDINWDHFQLPYCFPPFPLLQQVLDKCRQQEVHRMILVAPWWLGKPFFPALLSMLIDVRRIPVSSQLVVDLASGNPPPDLPRLKLVACLISGRSAESASTSPGQHRLWLRHPGEAQQRSDMVVPGGSGLSGAVAKEYRQLRPL